MDVVRLLFGFRGRTGRRQFWVLACTVNPIAALFIGLVALSTGAFSRPPSTLTYFVLGLLVAVQLWANLAVMAKRLHDRNRSAWFLLLLVLYGSVQAVASGGSIWFLLALLPMIVAAFWLVTELFFLVGSPGPNRFGPSPIGIAAIPSGPVGPIRYSGPTGELK
jgi:uncharacterized membrane protein YhaH (DUF805 family)